MVYIRSQTRSWGEAQVRDFVEIELRENRGYNEATIEYWEKCILLDDEVFRAYQEEMCEWADRVSSNPKSQPSFWNDTNFINPSLPVTGICWYEARAYCAWIGHCLGIETRLPTEAEWERAARGPRGWKYPWGDNFDLDRTNTIEGHIRRLSPVGAFPTGESPWGLHDLSGNAWEWTLSLWGEDYDRPNNRTIPLLPYDDYVNIDSPVNVLRVRRGGSFALNQSYAHAACCLRNSPSHQLRSVGFRLASPSLRTS
jgi:formylglycine-generating enzyme required for sulfatase activity